MVGVGAVVLRSGQVLLIRRAKEPLRGRWLVPGGRVRWGERLTEAVVRETREETGVVVAPREVLKVTDQVHRDAHAIRHHFVLVDYLCDYVSGEPKAASDAEAAAWVAQKDLGPYDVPAEMRAVLMDAYSRCASGGPRERGVES